MAEFRAAAASLDAAGLGPADFLYKPLKWRLENPKFGDPSLLKSLMTVVHAAVANPPFLPNVTQRAPILAASSYEVSGRLLRRVVATFNPGEAIFCDASETGGSRSPSTNDRLRALAALPSALLFAHRVRRVLKESELSSLLVSRSGEAAFGHAIHRRTARAVLNKTEPRCVVIANGNRSFEFALFAEAKARGIATVLLPFAELNLKPARFLSLCRGAFDLALPFSEYSAQQLRKIRPEIATEVVGTPFGQDATRQDATGQDMSEQAPGGRNQEAVAASALYICGNNFEEEAAALLHEAFSNEAGLHLRVRLHPRSRGAEARRRFAWLPEKNISDPQQTSLADDIAGSPLAITVRSTAALEVMAAGQPLLWLTPRGLRSQIDAHPLKAQKLSELDVENAADLRETVHRLLQDASERRRLSRLQADRLEAAGYNRNYFHAVTAALRRLVDQVAPGERDGLGGRIRPAASRVAS